MVQADDLSSPLVRGQILQRQEGQIVLALPGTDYQLHLTLDPSTPQVVTDSSTRWISGTIRAVARRVDVVHVGGRYIEPVYGRPRRLQGSITAINPARNSITVHCGCPFECTLTGEQKSHMFELGQLVSFDIERGATFHPLRPTSAQNE